MPSMMSPTVIARADTLVAGLGSGGSNRIRSAIVQTIVRLIAEGLPIDEAVESPRLHFEDGAVEAEPGLDPAELAAVEERGVPVHRWPARNLFFGGVHAVARDPGTGELRGAGDPRRGGAVAVA
jgi:gamma-glutamyltranspeptidase/glutathione hydrolase